MRQTIILGNIITMDEKRPFAKAALVKTLSIPASWSPTATVIWPASVLSDRRT